MKFIKFSVVAVAALAILSTSASAEPIRQSVPDTTSTVGLLGCAFVGLASLRAWLSK